VTALIKNANGALPDQRLHFVGRLNTLRMPNFARSRQRAHCRTGRHDNFAQINSQSRKRSREHGTKNVSWQGKMIPIWCDGFLATEARVLARTIVGANASPALLRLAERVAEAQIDSSGYGRSA
jgi:hypothetical protein